MAEQFNNTLYMPPEPITIFSHTVDPAGVLRVLLAIEPQLRVDGPDDAWTRVVVPVSQGLFGRPRAVGFTHDRGRHGGPGWARQRDGLRANVAARPASPRTADALRLVDSFRFSLGVVLDPPERADRPDERLAVVAAVVRHLGGVLFRPSAGLTDAAGRPLLTDPAAEWPAIPAADGLAEPTPPPAERVARRAVALAAVGARALLEREDAADPGVEQTRGRIHRWVDDVDAHDELEPDEWRVVQTPLGKLPPQDALDATWRLEGLGVLAWALGWFSLPPHDELCDPGQLLPAVGLLNAERARALLAEPSLRPAAALAAARERLFAVHWRLRNYRLRPAAMDFRLFAATAWFGPLDLTGTRLANDDLAVGDQPIAKAAKGRVQTASSATVERHRAANWLHGDGAVYSRVDVST